MFAKDLIADSIPSIKPTDSVGSVLLWMNEFKVSHLPLVRNESLVGIISEDDLIESDLDEKRVDSIRLGLPEGVFVFEDSHVYDALKMMSLYHLDILPVLDKTRLYQGLLTKTDMIGWLAQALGATDPGGVIVLEVQYNSYSMSEIGRICESNDAKVLSLTISPSPDMSTLYVTLKLNIRELSRLISTFERFEYKIAMVVFDTAQLNDFQQDYENLMKYLNI